MPYIGTSPSNGVRRVHTYTATASQTTFTGASSEGVTLSYADTNYIDVFQNGVLLGSADYTSTSGTSVVLAQGASVSDLVVIVVYDVFSVADTVSKTNGGSFDSAVTMSGGLVVADGGNIGSASDTDAISITSGGVVTQSAKPSFFAHGSSGSWQSVSSGGVVTELDSTDHNIGSCYDASNGKFTVPVTGVYCFQFNLYIKQTSNSASWSIYHNGSEFAAGGFPLIRVFRNDDDANDETIGCTWTYKYTASDYIEIRASGTTSEYVPYRSYFSGFMVG